MGSQAQWEAKGRPAARVVRELSCIAHVLLAYGAAGLVVGLLAEGERRTEDIVAGALAAAVMCLFVATDDSKVHVEAMPGGAAVAVEGDKEMLGRFARDPLMAVLLGGVAAVVLWPQIGVVLGFAWIGAGVGLRVTARRLARMEHANGWLILRPATRLSAGSVRDAYAMARAT